MPATPKAPCEAIAGPQGRRSDHGEAGRAKVNRAASVPATPIAPHEALLRAAGRRRGDGQAGHAATSWSALGPSIQKAPVEAMQGPRRRRGDDGRAGHANHSRAARPSLTPEAPGESVPGPQGQRGDNSQGGHAGHGRAAPMTDALRTANRTTLCSQAWPGERGRIRHSQPAPVPATPKSPDKSMSGAPACAPSMSRPATPATAGPRLCHLARCHQASRYPAPKADAAMTAKPAKVGKAGPVSSRSIPGLRMASPPAPATTRATAEGGRDRPTRALPDPHRAWPPGTARRRDARPAHRSADIAETARLQVGPAGPETRSRRESRPDDRHDEGATRQAREPRPRPPTKTLQRSPPSGAVQPRPISATTTASSRRTPTSERWRGRVRAVSSAVRCRTARPSGSPRHARPSVASLDAATLGQPCPVPPVARQPRPPASRRKRAIPATGARAGRRRPPPMPPLPIPRPCKPQRDP
jgi:hypothetical protein